MESTAKKNFTLRPLATDFSGRKLRYWNGGEAFRTHFFNALSICFPHGEAFFIESAMHFRTQVQGDDAANLILFAKQEANHSALHRKLNLCLEEMGFAAVDMERVMKNIISNKRHTSPLSNLAITVAFEHLTASMSDILMRKPEIFQGADPEVLKLWLWHSIEEAEHRSVAFDIYNSVGGGFLRRVAFMFFVTILFSCEVVYFLTRFLRKDGTLFSPRTWMRGINYLLFRPGFLRLLMPYWLEYFSWNYNPKDTCHPALVRAWELYLAEIDQNQLQEFSPASGDPHGR